MTGGDQDLGALCQACGFCCDGTLFARVTVDPGERVRRHLAIADDDRHFAQPCAALVKRSCSIYEDRPLACQRFVCRLYKKQEAEGGPLAARLAVIARVREIVAQLDGPVEWDDPKAVLVHELRELLDEFRRAS